MRRFFCFLLLQCICFFVAASQSVKFDRIFSKPYIAGSRPQSPQLSPDGATLLYQWDSSATGINKLWMTKTDGGRPDQALDSSVSSYVWSPDGKRIAYTRKGDIFITDRSFKKSTRLTKTPAGEGQLLWSHDGKYISATTNNILIFPTTSAGFFQLTNNNADNISYSVVDFSPNNKNILFVEYDETGLPEFTIPDYTGINVSTRTIKRGFSKVRVGIVPIDTGKIIWLKTTPERFLLGSISYSPDGKKVLLDQYSTNRKNRSIYACAADSGSAKLIYAEHDSTWIEEGILSAQWSQDGKSVYFLSERSGWNHLYQLTNDSSNVRTLTSGEWEINWFDESPSGDKIYFTANKEERGQWQMYTLTKKNGGVRKISTQIGTYASPALSEKEDVVVCSYSNTDQPTELYSFVDEKEHRLTATTTAEFRSIEWINPDFVQFASRDGKSVAAMLYKPKHLDTTKKYPCVVFVHGAGYLQNVFHGWSGYYCEYMFNNYLVNKGYAVFDVDYRGSAGYGRDFRRDVYMHLGGNDLNDELDGVEYLKKLGYIDSTRIGMYGGSYGGFLPLMALFNSPDTYACAAVLRAVTSWENYYRHNPWYCIGRLGIPDSNKEAYKKSSPITFADSLKKPLLILHGILDDNVFFQDAAQLVAKLQKLGKHFELMMYPAEAHGFTQPESWTDEYRRIDEFFDRHLLRRKN